MKLIYVVEDDDMQMDYVCNLLRDELDDVEVRPIRTESEFHNRFEEVASAKPACIIMDILIQWTEADPSDNSAGPGSFRSAGLRCQKRLSEDQRTKNIPLIFYTVLDKSDVPKLPNEIAYLRKDEPDHRFLALTRQLMGTRETSSLP